MPSLVGQVVVQQATVSIGTDPQGNRALIIVPQGTGLTIAVPMNEESCRKIGGALLAKHVVMPAGNGMPS